LTNKSLQKLAIPALYHRVKLNLGGRAAADISSLCNGSNQGISCIRFISIERNTTKPASTPASSAEIAANEDSTTSEKEDEDTSAGTERYLRDIAWLFINAIPKDQLYDFRYVI